MMDCVVVLNLGNNGRSFLAANLRAAADRNEENGFKATAADLRNLVGQVEDARPLVVIDPEDREQVERLLATYHDWKWDHSSASIEDMQAALRQLANPTPPTPEEPTGLGAVVKDHRGMWFVRCADGWIYAGGAQHEPGAFRNPLTWRDLTGITILDHGHTEGAES